MKRPSDVCFILGNSPSLSGHDLSKLDGLFTIGVNRILKIYDPTVHFYYDRKIKDCLEPGKTYECLTACTRSGVPVSLFSQNGCNQDYVDYGKVVNQRRVLPLYHQEDWSEATNIDVLVGRRCTGVSAALWALGLGFKKIYLLGMEGKPAEDGRTSFWGANKDHNAKTYEDYGRAMRYLETQPESVDIFNIDAGEDLEDYIEADGLEAKTRGEYYEWLWSLFLPVYELKADRKVEL